MTDLSLCPLPSLCPLFSALLSALRSLLSAPHDHHHDRRHLCCLRLSLCEWPLTFPVVPPHTAHIGFHGMLKRAAVHAALMVTGRNASGKSSFARVAAGLWPHTTGTVSVPTPAGSTKPGQRAEPMLQMKKIPSQQNGARSPHHSCLPLTSAVRRGQGRLRRPAAHSHVPGLAGRPSDVKTISNSATLRAILTAASSVSSIRIEYLRVCVLQLSAEDRNG